jgi:hypothetical protein
MAAGDTVEGGMVEVDTEEETVALDITKAHMARKEA